MMKGRSTNSNARLAWLDGLFALGMALTAVLYGNSARIPAGAVNRFLQSRITVSNALFAGVFMFVWGACFTALDLYRSESYGVVRKLLRIVEGCAAMTFFLGGYLYLSHTRGPTTHIAAIFFACSTFYQMCRVCGGNWIASRDPQLVVILGSGRRAAKAWRENFTRYPGTVKLIGFFDNTETSEKGPDVSGRYLWTRDEFSGLL